MKIEYLSKSSLPSRSANSVHVMKMCQAFASLGHDVTLHGLQGQESAEDDFAHYGVKNSFKLRKHLEKDLATARWLERLQRVAPFLRTGVIRQTLFGRSIARQTFQGRPDLIYARHLFWLLGAATTGVDFVFESHKPPVKGLELAAQRWLFRRPGFRYLVVISSKLKALYRESFPELPEEKIIVAHDGADPPNLQTPARIASVPGRLQAGYVGHLYPGRGIDLILGVAGQICDVDFHVVGGTDRDVAALKARALPPNLTVHGFVSPGEIGSFYASFDVFLAPYQTKVAVAGGAGDTSAFMSPLKIFEYMSWGKPLLASDLPVLREVLSDQETALLLPPADTDAWSAALHRLQENPQEAEYIGTAARNSFLSKYTWTNRARQILGALERQSP